VRVVSGWLALFFLFAGVASAEIQISLSEDGKAFLAKGAGTADGEFVVKVAAEGKDLPAMAGRVEAVEEGLQFIPLFPLSAGVSYRASVGSVSREFTIPEADNTPIGLVSAVYPNSDRLPENLLKFYIHFSEPMAIGEASRHVGLFEIGGEEVDLPFLELSEELWDPEGRRLTLFFDPGRIKRGLKPHQEEGRVLEVGKSYELRIDRGWRDAEGRELVEGHSKRFIVSEADYVQPDASKWAVGVPEAGSRDPLCVQFHERLDHGLLERVLTVCDANGERVAGEAKPCCGEIALKWTPDEPWPAGDFNLVADGILEDIAGNSLARKFEVIGKVKETWNVRGGRFVKVPFVVEPVVSKPERKPNVIVIFTDDQGSVDASCYGTKDIQTPAIDSLAKRGLRFSQFYAAAPVCSPSRAGLLTGRYPVRAGVPGNTTSTKGVGGMPASEVTMAEVFKASGYATGHIGKWHLGYTPETMPNAQGFDYSFGHMGGCIDNYSHFFYWAGPNRHDLHRNGKEVFEDGKFFPDLMVDEARGFIEKHQEDPFFIYFAMNAPHYPYQGDAHWLEKYKDVPEPRNLYNAFVSSLDARIGRLLETLDEFGLREDTIVVFQSDHGHSTEERAHFGGGSAGNFRGAKFSLFEGGIRVPAIVSWPGKLPEGEVRDQLAHSCDWLPTLAGLSGVPLVNEDLDGMDISAVLRDGKAETPHKRLHWMVGNDPKRAQWAVREGKWKLIGNPVDTTDGRKRLKPGNYFLSNLDEDLSEKEDWSKREPEVRARLLKAHEEWADKAKKR